MYKVMYLTWKIPYEFREVNGFKLYLDLSQCFLSFAVRINIFVRTAPIPQVTSIMPIDSQALILYNKWKEENIVANV